MNSKDKNKESLYALLSDEIYVTKNKKNLVSIFLERHSDMDAKCINPSNIEIERTKRFHLNNDEISNTDARLYKSKTTLPWYKQLNTYTTDPKLHKIVYMKAQQNGDKVLDNGDNQYYDFSENDFDGEIGYSDM